MQVAIYSNTAQGPLELRAYDYFAGAFGYLFWNGKQFVDDYDHGRLLQSAVTFDGKSEAFNPTEGGASADGLSPLPSTSVLTEIIAGATNRLATECQMAFWYPVNGVTLSNHYFRKYVKVEGNVVTYDVQFEIPANETHTSVQFETLCAYMPLEFSTFGNYDPATRDLVGVSALDNTLWSTPVLAGTADHQYVIGVYSPDPRVMYASGVFPGQASKWTTIVRIKNPAGTYRFRLFLVVGTLNDVTSGIQALHDNPPTGY